MFFFFFLVDLLARGGSVTLIEADADSAVNNGTFLGEEQAREPPRRDQAGTPPFGGNIPFLGPSLKRVRDSMGATTLGVVGGLTLLPLKFGRHHWTSTEFQEGRHQN